MMKPTPAFIFSEMEQLHANAEHATAKTRKSTMRGKAEIKVCDQIADDIFASRMYRYEDESREMLRVVVLMMIAGAVVGFALSVWGIL